jgi:enterochelin esterase-like enzyme
MRSIWAAGLLVAAALVPTATGSRDPIELTLRSTVFRNTRHIRVLLPSGYDDAANKARRYPVCYFLDGIAAFDAWGVPVISRVLEARGEIPPHIFVGVDNGGSTIETTNPVRDRASEYLPYRDQSWTSPDAPAPRGSRLPSFLFDEVLPLVNARFRTNAGPADTSLAGDSYAGAAVLYVALQRPAALGAILVESPSLHIGSGQLLRDARHATMWPATIYLGVGTSEGATPDDQREMLSNVRELRSIIATQHPEVRLHLEITPGAAHGYAAWHDRLPAALSWVLRRL